MRPSALACCVAFGLLQTGCQGPIERVLDMDEERSIVLDARACEDGDPQACTNIADILLRRERAGDLQMATQLLTDACSADAYLACVQLAGLADAMEAERILDEACQAGEAIACLRHADLERDSNPLRAYGLYGLACEDRLFEACLRQGEMLKAGEGVSADPEAAFALFRYLCADGGVAGCRENAKEMLDPTSPHADADIGEILAQRACSGGDAEGCWVSAQAATVPADADAFRARACEFGFDRACGDPSGP